MALKNPPDLTQRPPRSPYVRIGGYVLMARMLDKCRATIAGKNGEYHYNCPMDQRFLKFAGVDAAAVKKQVAAGNGDGEILEWVRKNSKIKRADSEIAAWSEFMVARAPGDVDSREYFDKEHRRAGPKREDISTWFDLLDVDDHVTFGGKA